MTAAKRAHRDAGSSASSPPMSLTALLGGAYRLLDSVAMVAPCAGGGHMITPWREAAGNHLKFCARPPRRRTRPPPPYPRSPTKQIVFYPPYLFHAPELEIRQRLPPSLAHLE